MTNILDTIIATKHCEVEQAKRDIPLNILLDTIAKQASVRGFANAILNCVKQQQSAVIAEIKKNSPSKGLLRHPFYPSEIAISYANNQAIGLSVLTDQSYFHGHSTYLQAARAACSLPVLRKDFIIDAYQIYESRAMGADAILLIAACLDTVQMQTFESIAHELNMDVLVEVHNKQELESALLLNTPLLGINNRNLSTFEVNLNHTIDLLPDIPDTKCVITESGIHSRSDVHLMKQHKVHAFLVGEALMRHSDPGLALQSIFFNE